MESCIAFYLSEDFWVDTEPEILQVNDLSQDLIATMDEIAFSYEREYFSVKVSRQGQIHLHYAPIEAEADCITGPEPDARMALWDKYLARANTFQVLVETAIIASGGLSFLTARDLNRHTVSRIIVRRHEWPVGWNTTDRPPYLEEVIRLSARRSYGNDGLLFRGLSAGRTPKQLAAGLQREAIPARILEEACKLLEAVISNDLLCGHLSTIAKSTGEMSDGNHDIATVLSFFALEQALRSIHPKNGRAGKFKNIVANLHREGLIKSDLKEDCLNASTIRNDIAHNGMRGNFKQASDTLKCLTRVIYEIYGIKIHPRISYSLNSL